RATASNSDDQTDKNQAPGEEQQAPSLSDLFPRSASVQNPCPRSASNTSLSDANPESRLGLDNLP
ncbi:hypothetical protein A2U01_0058144, partial [Trifolium medium]|nr:hypothetical protein [Trifolium medium]